MCSVWRERAVLSTEESDAREIAYHKFGIEVSGLEKKLDYVNRFFDDRGEELDTSIAKT